MAFFTSDCSGTMSPGRRRRPRAAVGAGFSDLENRLCLSTFYDVEVVTRSGDTTTTGDTINSFKADVSLNNLGRVAFVGNLSGASGTGTALVVDDGAAAPVKISFANPSASRDFALPQIADDNKVVARDRLSGSPAQTLVRTWDSNNAGLNDIVVRDGDEGPLGDYDSVTLGARSNDGGVAFVGLTGLATQTSLYFNSSGIRGLEEYVAGLSGGGFRPMAGDGGRTVIAVGSTVNSILLNADWIASTAASDWNSLGRAPGISDDGEVVAFYGDVSAAAAQAFSAANGDLVPLHVTPGKGVFVSVEIGGIRHLVRVAGELGSGHIDPGERRSVGTTDEQGPDFDFNGAAEWGIGSISADTRVAVSSLKAFADAARGAYVTVVYIADDVVNVAGSAIYASRVNFFKDSSGAITRIGVEAPIQVARVGESVDGFGPIASLAIYDPVNAEGQIAFWAADAGGAQAILRATLDFEDLVRSRDRFDPDSPLVEYVVQGIPSPSGRSGAIINQIVMHATGGRETGDIRTLTAGTTPSIHYLVSREGRVTQIINESDRANHAPASNNNTIGIELVDDFNGVNGSGTGHIENQHWATPLQLRKAALLVRDIGIRQGIPLTHLMTFGPPAVYEVLVAEEAGVTSNRNGIGPTPAGVLAHGQVLNRTVGRTDPQNFDWAAFMTRVNLGVGLTLNSPANLFVTDPLGRRVGVDPASGLTYMEIPGAQFSGAGTEPQTLSIPAAMFGDFTIQVVGAGVGDYHVDFLASGADATLMTARAAGVASPGAITTYTLARAADEAGSSIRGEDNLPPVALDDEVFAIENTEVLIGVLANDSDPEGALDMESVEVTAPPTHGSTSVDSLTGDIRYTPLESFVGVDSFRYLVRDAAGGVSEEAEVSIRFLAETIAPSASDDEADTTVGQTVAINVLSNDSDADGVIDPATVMIAHGAAPANGDVSIDATTGEIQYTPDAAFSGVDVFSYTVLDNDGAVSNVATVTVMVLADGEPPVSSVELLLPEQYFRGFAVSWRGEDGSGSGIVSYDIFVSIDAGPFTLWLDDSTLTSEIYPGAFGRTYAFFSVATDGAGLEEPQPVSPDTATLVVDLATVNFTNGQVIVSGGPDFDVVTFFPGNSAGQVRVRVNSKTYGPFTSPTLLSAHGNGGDDRIIVDRTISMPPAEFHGGDGKDRLFGGFGADLLYGDGGRDTLDGGLGHDRLFGGDDDDGLNGGPGNDFLFGEGGNDRLRGYLGNDLLFGGLGRDYLNGDDGNNVLLGGEANDRLGAVAGRNLLIGGTGRDAVSGGANGSILISGVTSHDANESALLAILAEWASTRSLTERVARLTTGVGAGNQYALTLGNTVQNDNSWSSLEGGPGEDWFFKFRRDVLLSADALVDEITA